MDQIKDFYSNLKFPGSYTVADLEFYDQGITNKYLSIFDNAIQSASTVLDVGCGSGFIVNLLARRHSNIKFDAIDFSDAIDYASQFSTTANINNVTYFKEDFLSWQPTKKYDVVICNGVLHHIPEYEEALKKIKSLATSKLVIGIYNPFGKLLKQIYPIKYESPVLYVDQEQCPFEVSFSDSEFRSMVGESELLIVHPGYKNHFVDLYNLANSKNGGLTVYVFKLI